MWPRHVQLTTFSNVFAIHIHNRKTLFSKYTMPSSRVENAGKNKPNKLQDYSTVRAINSPQQNLQISTNLVLESIARWLHSMTNLLMQPTTMLFLRQWPRKSYRRLHAPTTPYLGYEPSLHEPFLLRALICGTICLVAAPD